MKRITEMTPDELNDFTDTTLVEANRQTHKDNLTLYYSVKSRIVAIRKDYDLDVVNKNRFRLMEKHRGDNEPVSTIGVYDTIDDVWEFVVTMSAMNDLRADEEERERKRKAKAKD